MSRRVHRPVHRRVDHAARRGSCSGAPHPAIVGEHLPPSPCSVDRHPETVFTRCLVCHAPFRGRGGSGTGMPGIGGPGADALEHLPGADRIAYDPERGRLWAVCRECRRWSLAPIEERWEALDALEKIVTDEARLLSRTDNIALLRAEAYRSTEGRALEIVRIGRADRTEEAWWRYGRELRRRRRTYRKITLAGSATAAAVIAGGYATGGMALIGAWFLWGSAPEKFTDAARWLRFGSSAWQGESRCAQCGHRFSDLRFRDRGGIHLLPDVERGTPVLSYRCPRCGEHREGGLHLEGEEAERTLRRVLAYHHFEGAGERRVRAASRLIEEAGSPRDLTRIVVRDGRRLGDLQRTGGIALEIAASEASEQRLLELELAELEAIWRREEELASIVDGELTPLPLLEQLRRRMRGTHGGGGPHGQ